jgi:hypothetical protein
MEEEEQLLWLGCYVKHFQLRSIKHKHFLRCQHQIRLLSLDLRYGVALSALNVTKSFQILSLGRLLCRHIFSSTVPYDGLEAVINEPPIHVQHIYTRTGCLSLRASGANASSLPTDSHRTFLLLIPRIKMLRLTTLS